MTIRSSRRTYLKTLGVSSLAVLVAGPASLHAAEDSEQEVPLAKLPDAVRQSADKTVAGVKWAKAHLIKEEDNTFYELEGKDAKQRLVIVTVKPDGTVEDVTTEIPVKDVPAIVMDAVKAKWPKFKPKLAFEITEGGTATGYDLEGRRPKDKHDVGIYVSADGKTIEIDEDE